jgi:hypothetical protein
LFTNSSEYFANSSTILPVSDDSELLGSAASGEEGGVSRSAESDEEEGKEGEQEGGAGGGGLAGPWLVRFLVKGKRGGDLGGLVAFVALQVANWICMQAV